jgi:hypothetical protein
MDARAEVRVSESSARDGNFMIIINYYAEHGFRTLATLSL